MCFGGCTQSHHRPSACLQPRVATSTRPMHPLPPAHASTHLLASPGPGRPTLHVCSTGSAHPPFLGCWASQRGHGRVLGTVPTRAGVAALLHWRTVCLAALIRWLEQARPLRSLTAAALFEGAWPCHNHLGTLCRRQRHVGWHAFRRIACFHGWWCCVRAAMGLWLAAQAACPGVWLAAATAGSTDVASMAGSVRARSIWVYGGAEVSHGRHVHV